MDSFHVYLKKQLLEYVKAERKKGIPLEQIEKVLIDAGHHKNIIDEVFQELEKEEAGMKVKEPKDTVEKDLVSQLKIAFKKFMSQAQPKDVEKARKDFEKTDTEKIVKQVIEEAEVIEEKTILESFAFFIYLVFLALIVLFSSGATDTDIVKVILGFSPAIFNAFLSFILLNLADNVPVYVSFPVWISSAFYGIVKFTNFNLFQSMDIEALVVVNFLLGFVFNVFIVYVRFIKPPHFKKRVRRKPKTSERQEIIELKKEFNI